MKISRIFLTIVIILFIFPFYTGAELAPRVYVSDLKIGEISDSNVKGEFVVSNSEQYYLNDLNYEIKLLETTQQGLFEVIDVFVSNEIFSVAPGGKTNKNFMYSYPQNIVSGDYTLRVQVMNARGVELGWQDKTVELIGDGKFLDILPESQISYLGDAYPPLYGVNISKDDSVTGIFKVDNPEETITVTPHVKIFQRQFNMSVVKEYDDTPITFAKGEEKEINLEFPKFDTPESYLAEVKFYQNNKQVSGIQYFRWVVKGESGKIIYVKTDKDYYKAGESINLTVDSIGPADNSDIGSGKLEVSVFDRNDKLVGSESIAVVLNSSLITSVISIPVSEVIIYPKIETRLIKNGKVLDERTITLEVLSAQAKQIENSQGKGWKYFVYLTAILLLIIILTIGFFIFKFKFKNKWKR